MKTKFALALGISALLSILLLTSLQAQTRSQRRPSTRSRGTTPSKPTPTPTPTPSPTPTPTITLSVVTGIVVNSGDVKPVARVQFYLLDDSLENIVRESGYEPLPGVSSILRSFAATISGNLRRGTTGDDQRKALEAIKSHAVAQMTTDFGGKGEFEDLKAGKYYLAAITPFSNRLIIWNYEIDVRKSQTVILDQNNAAILFSR